MAFKVNGTTIEDVVVGNTVVTKVLAKTESSSSFTEVYQSPYIVAQTEDNTTNQFAFDKTTGYWVSQNKGNANSYALCKITFPFAGKYTVQCISNGETNYDYTILSDVNYRLSASNTADSTSNSTQSITKTVGIIAKSSTNSVADIERKYILYL